MRAAAGLGCARATGQVAGAQKDNARVWVCCDLVALSTTLNNLSQPLKQVHSPLSAAIAIKASGGACSRTVRTSKKRCSPARTNNKTRHSGAAQELRGHRHLVDKPMVLLHDDKACRCGVGRGRGGGSKALLHSQDEMKRGENLWDVLNFGR